MAHSSVNNSRPATSPVAVRSLQEMLKDSTDMSENSSAVQSAATAPTARQHPTSLALGTTNGMQQHCEG